VIAAAAVMPGRVPGIHGFLDARRGWPVIRAFTPVFDGLCPAMTTERATRSLPFRFSPLPSPAPPLHSQADCAIIKRGGATCGSLP
jgi:hypothetical protein